MPTYEYRCEACNHQFEVFARMSDPDPETCESCAGGPVTKVLFAPAVHYKGSGFYATDYKSKATSGSSSASSSSDSSSASDSGSSTSTSDSSSSNGSGGAATSTPAAPKSSSGDA